MNIRKNYLIGNENHLVRNGAELNGVPKPNVQIMLFGSSTAGINARVIRATPLRFKKRPTEELKGKLVTYPSP